MYIKKVKSIFKLAFVKDVILKGLTVALVIGVLLNLINNPEAIITLSFEKLHWIKVLLTFFVPYCVSVYTSVSNKITFKPGEIAQICAMLNCRKCKHQLLIQKGQIIPKCVCEGEGKWQFLYLFNKCVNSGTPLNFDEFNNYNAEKVQSLALFAHYNPSPVFRINDQGIIIETNLSANEFFNYPTLLHTRFNDLVKVKDEIDFTNIIENNLTINKVYDIKGKSIKLEFKGLADKQICQVYGADVTEIKKTKLENIKLFAAIEQSSNSIMITGKDGKIEFVNTACCQISGYNKEDLIGKSPNILKTGYTPDTIYKELWQTISSGKVWRGEFLNKRKDSTNYWEAATISPIFNLEGEIFCYMAVKEDITELKKANDEIRSMALFAKLNPEPVFRFGHDGIILQSNPAANAMFVKDTLIGLQVDELLKNTVRLKKADIIAHNQVLVLTENIGENIYRFILRGIAEFNICQIYGSDITERVRAAEEIKRQKDNIEQQNAEITAQRDEIEKQNYLLTDQNKKISSQNTKITDSIRYASLIQRAMLPDKAFLFSFFKDYYVLYKPKDIVSGDFYWVAKKNECIYFAVADCTGHGVPGAFMSMLGISYLNELLANNIVDNAAHLLNMLREKIINTFTHQNKEKETHDGMDIALVIIDVKTYKMHYAGAYNSCLLMRNNEITELEADKMPVGIHIKDNIPFTNNEIRYYQNDTIYMFSDGYADQFGGDKGKKFMSKPFKEMLRQISHRPMDYQKVYIENILDKWKGEYEQVDDITVIGIRL